MLISRGRICHRASTDICMVETESDRIAIIATRLVDEVGCTMIGGVPTFGNALAWVIRSCVIWRAACGSVPGSNSQVDGGKTGHRFGADVLDPGDAVQQVLF